MTSFPKVSPGTPAGKSPANSSSWINAVTDATAYFQSNIAGGNSKSANKSNAINPSIVKVKNITGGDLLRGAILQLGDSLLTDVNYRTPWFEADSPDGGNEKIVILRVATKSNDIGEAQVVGVSTAVVNVTDTTHEYASTVASETLAVSSDSGQMRILSPLTATGEQEVAVLLGIFGLQKILITSTIAAVGWNGTTNKLTPVSFTAKLLTLHTDDDGTYTYDTTAGSGEITAVSFYSTAITISIVGQARFGYVQNGELVIADCTEITL